MVTDITIILDRSSSMSTCAEGTIDGYNEFLDEQEDGDDPCEVTLFQFNTEVESVYEQFPPRRAPRLTFETFVPGGMTALYDAIGQAISQARSRCADSDNDRIYVVITDGKENSSQEITYEDVRNLIEKEKDEGHSFVFLGAAEDIDAIDQAEDLGISADRAMNYAGDDQTTRAAYASTSRVVGSLRADEEGEFNDEDREKANKDQSEEFEDLEGHIEQVWHEMKERNSNSS